MASKVLKLIADLSWAAIILAIVVVFLHLTPGSSL